MNDYSAADMHCGDLFAAELQQHFHLSDVSTKIDPYTLEKISVHIHLDELFFTSRSREKGNKIDEWDAFKILFDEFRDLSEMFALYGPYKNEIKKMITHMQYGKGQPYQSATLNAALKEQILEDTSVNSTLQLVKKTLTDGISKKDNDLSGILKRASESIYLGKVPKFDRLKDSFNGLGITVHDVWATNITLTSLQIYNGNYKATLNYKIQDHFGLDDQDILDLRYRELRFFRIWFVLQRYREFAFKPFMTNMEANIEFTG